MRLQGWLHDLPMDIVAAIRDKCITVHQAKDHEFLVGAIQREHMTIRFLSDADFKAELEQAKKQRFKSFCL